VALKDFVNQTKKLRATIHTVDIQQGVIQVITMDGSSRQIANFETPAVFRWPKQDEQWAIYEENGYWKLGGRFLNDEEIAPIRDLQEGELFIDADSIPLLDNLLKNYVINGDQIAPGTITGSNILPGSLPGSVLVPDSIGTALIAPGSIHGVQIAGGTISAENIRAYTITANQIFAGTITARQIAAGTITANVIAAGAITANEIATHTLTARTIAAGTITANEIGANTITANNIATGTITATLIAAGTITANLIAANTITANQIAANTITAGQIAAGAITAGAIQAGSINSTHIQAYSIAAINIGADAITTNAILAGSVTANKISVTTLSSLTSNMGSINAGTITGGTIQSGTTGARVVLDSLGIRGYALDGVTKTFEVNSGSGVVSLTGIVNIATGSIVPTSALTGIIPTTLLPPAGGGNLLSNSFYDSLPIATSVGATLLTPATGADPEPIYGKNVLVLTGVASYQFFTPLRTGVSGKQMTYSAWVKPSAAMTGAALTRVVQLGMDLSTSNGTYIGRISQDFTLDGTHNWQRLVWTFTPDATAAKFDCFVYDIGMAAGEVFYWDAAQLEVGGVVSAYAPRVDEIVDGAVIAGKIAANAVTANTIAANAVTAGTIAANAVTVGTIAAGAVTANTIDVGAVRAQNISVEFGGTNMLLNSSFEDPTAAVWTGVTYVTPSTTVGTVEGVKVGQATVSSGVAGISQTLPGVLSGKPYTFSYYAKASAAGYTATPVIIVNWYNSSSTYISQSTAPYNVGSATTLTNSSWNRITGTVISPVNAASAIVYFYIYDVSTGHAYYFDACQVEPGELASAYARHPGEILTGEIGATKITPNSITSNQILAGSILAASIATGTLTANEIAANTITAAKLNITSLDAITANIGNLTGGSITGSAIYTGSDANNRVAITSGGITATYGGVQKFSFNTANGAASFTGAINATSGTFTGTISASTINGSTVQTATSGARVVLDTSGLRQYDSSNAVQVNIPSSGALAQFNGHLSPAGMDLKQGTVLTPSSDRRIRWMIDPLSSSDSEADLWNTNYLGKNALVVIARRTDYGDSEVQLTGQSSKTYTYPGVGEILCHGSDSGTSYVRVNTQVTNSSTLHYSQDILDSNRRSGFFQVGDSAGASGSNPKRSGVFSTSVGWNGGSYYSNNGTVNHGFPTNAVFAIGQDMDQSNVGGTYPRIISQSYGSFTFQAVFADSGGIHAVPPSYASTPYVWFVVEQ
jgi:hypothetical protein